MLLIYNSIALTLLVLAQSSLALNNINDLEPSDSNLEHIQSPMLEVFMHLPPNFRQLQNALNIPQKQKRDTQHRSIVHVRNYEITQPAYNLNNSRSKREAKPASEKPELPSLASLPTPEAIRGPSFTKYSVKEFDVVDIDDPDDQRHRRNGSFDGFDDGQRDRRTFLEEGSGETTTPLPFWKRKKESPPFVTGRGNSVQQGSNYPPAQHRSVDSVSARESHSLKNLDKTVQSNEISRTNQDNYYSATNRRTYSRQYDGPPSSTPKSVYDTIDYNQKRNQDSNRHDGGRNPEEKKDNPREIRPTHEQYNFRPFQYNVPWMYDRPYYQAPYYPNEVIGRGVEYYHRTYDPSIGRIIYYANMPDQGRSYDYRYMDPINRSFYVNRPFNYDPYFRNYIPPYDYRFNNGFGRSLDYLRSGRSSSYQFQDREKFPRDARFNGAFETGNRPKDDFKNKTYIIYDAEERRSQFSKAPFNYDNRPTFTPRPSNPPVPQTQFRQFGPPSADYFPPRAFPFRSQFYPSSPGPFWGYNQRSTPGITDSKANSRPKFSPEVQLPLTTSLRGEQDKTKKA